MIRLRTDHFSESLGMSTSMVVLMPQSAQGQVGLAAADDGAPSPVLYLLHGHSDDATAWERRTSIERYASEKGIAVVMPEVRRSFYTDEALGEKYWTYVTEELPEIVRRTFRVSTQREDTFVAGLSMGGFGAFKLALNRPDRFAAAASLSGALVLDGFDLWDRQPTMRRRIFGDAPIAGSIDDLPGLLERAAPGTLPALYVLCGTEDRLLGQTEKVIAIAEDRGHPLTVDLRPGDHEWGLWDAGIRDVLDWLPIRGR